MKKLMKMALAALLAAAMVVTLAPQAAQAKTIYNMATLKNYSLNEKTGKFELQSETNNTYDSKGNETKSVSTYYPTGGEKEVTTTKTSYTKYGECSTCTKTDSNGNYSRDTYSYTSKNVLTKIVTTNKKKKTVNTVTLTYDKKGNLTKRVSKGDDNSTLTYTYDSKGNITKEKYKSTSNPEYSYTWTWTYKSGKPVSSKIVYADGTTETQTYKSGVLYKTVYQADGYKSVDYYYTSGNAKGMMKSSISKSTYDGTTYKNEFTYTYTFDSKGNLKTQVCEYQSDGYSFKSTTKYAYDKAGNRTIQKIYDEDGTCTSKTYYTWLKQKV